MKGRVKYVLNIEILYVLIIHRVLWNRNSVKKWQGVTFIRVLSVKCPLLRVDHFFLIDNPLGTGGHCLL